MQLPVGWGKKLLETSECCQNSNETWGWVKSSIDNMKNRQNSNKALGLVQCSIGTIECHQKVTEISDWTQGSIVTLKSLRNGTEISGCVQARQFQVVYRPGNLTICVEKKISSYCKNSTVGVKTRLRFLVFTAVRVMLSFCTP